MGFKSTTTTYVYQILRYRPDQVSGEFANVGLVVFSPEEQFFAMKTIDRIGRIKQLFPEVNSRQFVKKLHQLRRAIEAKGKQLFTEMNVNQFKQLDQITASILPPDDSALYFTEVKSAIDISMEHAFEQLFQRMVPQSTMDGDEIITDKHIWTQLYKSYFEAHELDRLLTKHSVSTKDYNIEFDYAIKNGNWHYFEPVTFDLSRDGNIRDKVHKGVGRLAELDESDEHFKLYLLSKLPDNPKLASFIKERLDNQKTDNYEVELVEPEEAEELMEELVGKF